MRLIKLARVTVAIFCITACRNTAHGEGVLKTIDNPGGGQIIYGPVSGQSSLQGAMGAVLRSLHSHFGDRPQIGKFFRAGGSDSAATFFTVTAKTLGGKPIAGMAIVSMLGGNQPGAAVMYDDAPRFGKTMSVMMKKLNDVWHAESPLPVGVAPSTAGPEVAAAPQPLHRTPFPDGTGSVGLPAGWHITGGGAGSVSAAGPNGEVVVLAAIWQMLDPSTAAGRGLIQYQTMGGKQLAGRSAIYPYRGDLLQAWIAGAQQSAQRTHQPTPTFTVSSSTQTADGLVVTGELDNHDGKGPLTTKLQLGRMPNDGGGQWAMTVGRLSVPKALAKQEWPTVALIGQSINQDANALSRLVAQKQNEIHAIGRAADIRNAATQAANDAHNRSVEAMWDSQAKRNQAFDNYITDRAVVMETESNAHGTFDYPTADWLVRLDPNRFQYVATENFLKGIDY